MYRVDVAGGISTEKPPAKKVNPQNVTLYIHMKLSESHVTIATAYSQKILDSYTLSVYL